MNVVVKKKHNIEIKYKNKNLNFVNESSRYFDYENENNVNNICLSIFQNKLRNIIIVDIDFSIKFNKCEKISNVKLTKFFFEKSYRCHQTNHAS